MKNVAYEMMDKKNAQPKAVAFVQHSSVRSHRLPAPVCIAPSGWYVLSDASISTSKT
jgi:hypothetical protein